MGAIEIEVTTYCNWRCKYCPVAVDPKPKESMTQAFFEHILDKVVEYKKINVVSINSYNEPTLDPLFMERIEALKARDLYLLLHTNGSGLNKAKIQRLKELGNVGQIVFNMPSLDPVVFRGMTRFTKHETVIKNIDLAIAAGLNVMLMVNGTHKEVRANLPELKARYALQLKSPLYWLPEAYSLTNDRAGVLKNDYSKNLYVDDPCLFGCDVPNEWLYIDIHGNLFACCMDYYRKLTFGHIDDGSIEEILASPKALKVFGYIFGVEPAPADWLCRTCERMYCFKLKS